jgi:phospholipid transport system substrate-binding protein
MTGSEGLVMLARRAFLLSLVPVAAVAQPGPAAPIAGLNAALEQVMRAGRGTGFAARAATLRPAVERAFDLPAILAASVGPRFAAFPEAAKAELLEAFTAFTVATWVGNFDAYAGERFEVAAETRALGADQVVTSRIVPASGEATRLDFVMRQGAQGWKAVDILLNGTISRVAVQRSDFRALVAGGDPGPLLASLRSRAASLAAGAKP